MKRNGTARVFMAAVAWGTGGAAADVLYRTSDLGPIAVSFWRNVGGALLLGAYLAVRGRRWTGPWRPLVTTGVGLVVYQTAYFASVRYAGVAVATIVTLGTGPVLMAAGDRILFAHRLSRGGALSIAGALAGLGLLVAGGSRSTASGHAAWGIALALLSAFGYAGVTLLTRHLGRGGQAPDPQVTALVGFAVGVACLAPLAVAEGLWPTHGATAATVGLLAYLGAVPSALAYALFFAGLATVTATTASVIALVEPLSATLIAMTLLGEHGTVTAAIGAAALLASVLAKTLADRQSQTAPRAAVPPQTSAPVAADLHSL